jgi:outer membrane protein TolC
MIKIKQGLQFFVFLLLCLCAFSGLHAQSSRALSEKAFIQVLLQNHPKARRAMLQREVGLLEINAAKGAFDPQVGAAFYRKEFQDKIYYNKLDAGLVQPFRFLGMDIQAGLELNNGTFLNPERNTPVAGLAYAGLKLPLLQGMMMDRRRTDLQLSNLFKDRTDIQFADVQNDLLIDGLKAYWNLVKVQQKIQLLSGILENNRLVFQGIKLAFLQGDRPAIDTVEAFQQYQRILLQFNKEQISMQSALNLLQSYTFNESGGGMALQINIVPSEFGEALINTPELKQMLEVQNLLDLHPGIRLLRNEADRLNTQLRWERERLKPRLDVHYNLLADTGMSPLEQTFFNDNYQVGVTLQFPLLFRNARARTEQFKIYIRQNQFALSDEFNYLENAVEASTFAMNNLKEQVALAQSITSDAKRLYDAEVTRFSLGESSVFLVNTRELQYLHAQNTLIDLQTEEIMQTYRLMFDLGILFRIVEY